VKQEKVKQYDQADNHALRQDSEGWEISRNMDLPVNSSSHSKPGFRLYSSSNTMEKKKKEKSILSLSICMSHFNYQATRMTGIFFQNIL
jgi:hypothetical protein